MLESLLEGMAEYYSPTWPRRSAAATRKMHSRPSSTAARCRWATASTANSTTSSTQPPHRWCRRPSGGMPTGRVSRPFGQILNGRGIRTSLGRPFTKGSFQTMLKNRRYLGEYRYKDTVIPDAIPAIIDPELFEQVQRRCERNKKAPAHTKTQVNFMLTTKAFCGKMRRDGQWGKRQKSYGYSPLLL